MKTQLLADYIGMIFRDISLHTGAVSVTKNSPQHKLMNIGGIQLSTVQNDFNYMIMVTEEEFQKKKKAR